VIEYDHGHFLAAAWDNNKYIFIDHEQERIETIVVHPHKLNFAIRCWGLAKVPQFDIVSCPFVIARDNIGLVLIDVKNYRAFMFT